MLKHTILSITLTSLTFQSYCTSDGLVPEYLEHAIVLPQAHEAKKEYEKLRSTSKETDLRVKQSRIKFINLVQKCRSTALRPGQANECPSLPEETQ
ncbi:MAG TPA: hypothetical protein QGF02_00430 [Candidatus Babeliales bacterium]|nr:hypothetical protein [Candidatus Babeliales bacterium]